MGKKPHKIQGETAKAYRAFLDYLSLNGKRSLRRLVAEHSYAKNSVERWSAENQWQERSAQHDARILADSIGHRRETLDRIRQRLVDRADAAVDVMFMLLDGKIPEGSETIAQMDRNGEKAGEIPIVKPSTLMQQAVHVLEFAGLIKPKRVELSGPDGDAIQLRAQDVVDALSDNDLEDIAARLKNGENIEERR